MIEKINSDYKRTVMKAGHDQVETVQQDWEGKGHSLQLVESSINSVWSAHSVASSYLNECEVKTTLEHSKLCNFYS